MECIPFLLYLRDRPGYDAPKKFCSQTSGTQSLLIFMKDTQKVCKALIAKLGYNNDVNSGLVAGLENICGIRRGRHEREVRIPLIEVQNLTRRFGEHTVVNHLNFKIKQGAVCGFLGPNGAGKSTTMNMITGYLAPSDGTALICGIDMMQEPEKARRHIGYLPEIPALYPEMTVREYLNFTAALKRFPKRGRPGLVDDAIEKTYLGAMQNRLIGSLSKGYRQRVGVANAILGMPEVIILDEPTVGLDPQQIIEIRDLIRSLSGEHTVLLSSHILSEVSELCDHILILCHGNLAAAGTPEELERTIDNSRTYELVVAGEYAQAVKALSGIEGVAQIRKGTAAGQTGEPLIITRRGENDIRIPIFRALAQADLPILSMQEQSCSLETVFLRLTAGNRPAAQKEES